MDPVPGDAMTGDDNDFDNLFRSHFAGELDPMRGQARRAFEREVVRPMHRRLRVDAARAAWQGVGRRAGPYASVGLAVAAAAAVGFFLPRAMVAPPAVVEAVADSGDASGPAGTTPASAAPLRLADYERTHVLGREDRGDAGDGGRAVRRNEMEAARFVDPATRARTEYLFFPAEPENADREPASPSARQ